MDAEGIIYVLEHIGARNITPGRENITCSCLFAAWDHAKGTDRRPSMSIKVEPKGPSVYCCFACNHQGTFAGMLLMLNRRYGVPMNGIVGWVAEREKQDLKAQLSRVMDNFGPNFVKKMRKAEFDVWDEAELEPFKGRVPKYVLSRGVSIETCREWEIGFDRKVERLVFPVRRKDGALVGMVGRAIWDKQQPPYKNYWNFQKSLYLYGEHKISKDDVPLPGGNGVVVVEGFFDLLKLWGMGYRRVVAIMGSTVSDAQADKLLGFGLPVYVMLDWDLAGNKGREKIIRALKGKVPLFDVTGPDGKDPDDLTTDELQERLKDAQRVL